MTTQTPETRWPNETPKVRAALAEATCLEDLRDLFPSIEDATDLPTFGGDAPATGTDEIWSWDAERLLVGTCDEDIRIVDRREWAGVCYMIESRITGTTQWMDEGSGDEWTTREAAESAAATLEPVNDEGRALEYRVVELHR